MEVPSPELLRIYITHAWHHSVGKRLATAFDARILNTETFSASTFLFLFIRSRKRVNNIYTHIRWSSFLLFHRSPSRKNETSLNAQEKDYEPYSVRRWDRSDSSSDPDKRKGAARTASHGKTAAAAKVATQLYS